MMGCTRHVVDAWWQEHVTWFYETGWPEIRKSVTTFVTGIAGVIVNRVTGMLFTLSQSERCVL
jgi:hypothetical protein